MLRDTSIKLFRDERGQALVMTAVIMTCILCFVGLATDVGVLLLNRRNIQAAADYAALAGAQEIRYATVDGKTVSAVALAATAESGFTNGSGGVTVNVNNGPLNGPHVGDVNYVEVLITRAVPTYFLNVFQIRSMNVSARSVAGIRVKNQYCAYVLEPQNPGYTGGGSNVNTFINCSLLVDSTSSNALKLGSGSLSASSVSVVGGVSGGTISPTPTLGVAQVSDPLGFLTLPNPSALSCNAPPKGILTGTIINSGIACYSGTVTINNAVLGQGTYVFTGDVTLSGNVTSGGSGVTLDMDSGSLTTKSGAAITISAPTIGTYSGIALMQSRSNSNQLSFATGSSASNIVGIFYAPNAQLFLQDNAGTLSITADLIVRSIYNKTSSLTVTSYSQSHPTSVLKFVGLAE